MAHTGSSSDSTELNYLVNDVWYSDGCIQAYEFLYGRSYLSAGGKTGTEEFVDSLNVKPGDTLLDVGSGNGGTVFTCARKYGTKVHGVDFSAHMYNASMKYLLEMEEAVQENVTFELNDILNCHFEPNTFDMVYSRDAIMHIPNKYALFSKIFTWLKPGGKFIFTDYNEGNVEEKSDIYQTYWEECDNSGTKMEDYKSMLEKAGFVDVESEDRTTKFVNIHTEELRRFNERKSEFLKTFKQEYFDFIYNGWTAKIHCFGTGENVWGFFKATKLSSGYQIIFHTWNFEASPSTTYLLYQDKQCMQCQHNAQKYFCNDNAGISNAKTKTCPPNYCLSLTETRQFIELCYPDKLYIVPGIMHRLYMCVVSMGLLLGGFALADSGTKPNPDTLRLVQVVFRHGDRSPTKTYPNDPDQSNLSPELWPAGLGQLTDIGKQQQYELGLYLHSRYEAFIPSFYTEGQVRVTSSDTDRTIMSVECTLAGLFQPLNMSSNWNPDLQWMPTPFHTIPKYEDNLLQMKKPCPKLKQLEQAVYQSQFYLDFVDEIFNLTEYVRINGGFESSASLDDILSIQQTVLTVLMAHNMSLPDWATPEVIQELLTAGVRLELTKTRTNEMKRLWSGPLLKDILQNMDHVVNGSKLKLVMYSGHDSTLIRFMDTLGVFKELIVPPYAAMFVAELHENPDNDFYVKVFYRNDSSEEPVQLTVPGCNFQCPLTDLVNLTRRFVPHNWNEECGYASILDGNQHLHKGILIALVVSLIGSLVLNSFFVFRQTNRPAVMKENLINNYGAIHHN